MKRLQIGTYNSAFRHYSLMIELLTWHKLYQYTYGREMIRQIVLIVYYIVQLSISVYLIVESDVYFY